MSEEHIQLCINAKNEKIENALYLCNLLALDNITTNQITQISKTFMESPSENYRYLMHSFAVHKKCELSLILKIREELIKEYSKMHYTKRRSFLKTHMKRLELLDGALKKNNTQCAKALLNKIQQQ